MKNYPGDILPLCDALWNEPNYDVKQLASRLLGQAPVSPPDQVIERLETWIRQDFDNLVLDGLLKYGLERLLSEAPGKLLELVSSWLAKNDHQIQVAGLRAMISLIQEIGAENLPVIFRLITPYVRVAPTRLRPDIVAALTALAHYSPAETAYFLRQNLAVPENPDTAWLIRRVIGEFPAEVQLSLRKALKGVS
jgi:hypothetical protein